MAELALKLPQLLSATDTIRQARAGALAAIGKQMSSGMCWQSAFACGVCSRMCATYSIHMRGGSSRCGLSTIWLCDSCMGVVRTGKVKTTLELSTCIGKITIARRSAVAILAESCVFGSIVTPGGNIPSPMCALCANGSVFVLKYRNLAIHMCADCNRDATSMLPRLYRRAAVIYTALMTVCMQDLLTDLLPTLCIYAVVAGSITA